MSISFISGLGYMTDSEVNEITKEQIELRKKSHGRSTAGYPMIIPSNVDTTMDVDTKQEKRKLEEQQESSKRTKVDEEHGNSKRITIVKFEDTTFLTPFEKYLELIINDKNFDVKLLNFEELSSLDDISIDFIKKYPYLPWVWYSIFRNKDLSVDDILFFKKHITENIGEYQYNLSFFAVYKNKYFKLEWMKGLPGEKWAYEVIVCIALENHRYEFIKYLYDNNITIYDKGIVHNLQNENWWYGRWSGSYFEDERQEAIKYLQSFN